MHLNHWPTLAARYVTLVSILAALSIASPTYARSYDVEVIIFEHLRDTNVGSSQSLLLPVVRGARTVPPVLTPTAAEPNAPIQALPTLRLEPQAEKIKTSNNHRLLYHGGWRQIDFDQENAPYMRIALGSAVSIYTEPGDADSVFLRGYTRPPANSPILLDQKRTTTLNGGIKVWVGRFLHFDTLLAYTPRGGTRSFAMQSERRMRSRQMHYIDNPRFGIITKIFPVDETAPN